MKRTVLIVDDFGDCAETLELALSSMIGLRVSVVHSAEEALERFQLEPIAAMITDLHLPGMDGLGLLTNVRKLKSHEQLPVFVISGDSDPSTPARAMAAGAQAFFIKPYSPAAVRRKLEELLG